MLEELEDRLVLSVSWINPSGGDWDTPSNWNADRVPTATDDVVVDTPGITITHDTGASDSAKSLTCLATLDLSAGSLSILGPSTLSTVTVMSASLSLSSATIQGPSTISAGAFVSAVNTTWADVTVNNSTFQCDGPQNMTSLSVVNRALVDHPPVTSTATHSLNLIVSGTVDIDPTSSINVTNEGYAPGYTTGNTTTGGATGASGGSYAGPGGVFPTTDTTNAVYGSYALPDDWGSGAAYAYAGGGLVQIQAQTLQLDGQIIANGGQPNGGYAPADSGGSILLNVGILAGAGLIQAAGGHGYYGDTTGALHVGSGGGGRIAVYAKDMSDFNLANITAPGGSGPSSVDGGPGTIYLDNTTTNTATLIVDATGGPAAVVTPLDISAGGVTALVVRNSAQVALQPTVTSASLTVTSGASLSLSSSTIQGSTTISNGAFVSAVNTTWADVTVNDSTLQCDGPQNMTSLSVVNHGLINHPAVTPTATHSLDLIVSGTVDIDPTSSINVTNEGYAPGYTTGNTTTDGATGASGGSYAGPGGVFPTTDTTNPVYGSYALPDDWGSGAAYAYAGGGLVQIQAQTLQLDGQIIANGGQPNGGYAPAGSGGSILLTVGTLTGAGLIQAAGGHAYYGDASGALHVGSGGGGRIAVYAKDMSGFNLADITAPGGSGPSSVDGGPGTIYLDNTTTNTATLIVDATGGPAAVVTPLDISAGGVTALVVRNSAQVALQPTVTSASLTVTSGASLSLSSSTIQGSTTISAGAFVAALNTTWANVTVNASTLQCDGPQNMTGLSVVNHGLINQPAVTPTATHSLDLIVSGTVDIDPTSSINVTNEGYAPGYTTGNTTTGGATGASGGSYAGPGGIFPTNTSSDAVYGSYALPDDWGSGAAYAFAGGGLVQLQAQTLQLDGQIIADGGSPGGYAPAGSGGSILLDVGTLTGAGVISAAGGNGYYGDTTGSLHVGSGGGGRIAVYARDMSGFNLANITAPGGSGASSVSGGPGTVYLDNTTTSSTTLIVSGVTGAGTADTPLAVTSQDLGNVAQGFLQSSALGALILGGGVAVELEASPAGATALYVGALVVPSGTTLNLNGLHLYARSVQILGSVVGGVLDVTPPGPLVLGTPAPGQISADDQIDDWSLLGQAGQAVSLIVNTGSLAAAPPQQPYLNDAQVQLVGPTGNILATATSPRSGADDAILGATLQVTGDYHVQVSVGEAGSRGDYILTGWNSPVNSFPLDLNQTVTGQLSNPHAVDQWAFSATANTEVQFHLLAAANPSIQFDLAGPNGWVGFAGLTTSSDPIALPSSGNYVLTVGTVAQAGAYAFELEQLTVTSLTLGSAFTGALAGSMQGQLFEVTLPEISPLLVALDDSSSADQNELYLKLGSPPTRSDYQFRYSNLAAADQQILVPSAAPGQWYALVYSDSVPSPSTYTLTASTSSIFLTGLTPSSSSTTTDTTMVLTGAGFNSGTTVSLLVDDDSPNGPILTKTTYPLTSLTVDSPTRISVTIPAGSVPAERYTVQVQQADGSTAELNGAFTMIQGGQAVLKTSIILPNPMGYHIGSTLYLDYSNTGDAPMPAPILTLSATDSSGSSGALMTLDPSRIISGIYTSAVPVGYSTTIQVLASGATPGILQPGESMQVPVYYAGWQQPYHPGPFTFTVGVLNSNNTTPIDWTSLEDSLRPSSIGTGAWNAIYPTLTAQMGSTWGQYVERLDSDAGFLADLGENVTDLSQLWSFEIQQASGFSSLSQLASSTDAQVPAQGIPLSFTRTFGTSIIDRNQFGSFGWGWTDSWQTVLTAEPDGTVVITNPDGSERVFEPDVNGGYFDQPGDHGTLAQLSDGGYTLTELDGTVSSFLPDGNLDYLQDATGNRIVAGYASGLLTSLTSSSGQSLLLTYNAANLVSSITDSAGRLTTYQYDPSNQYLTSVSYFNGQTTSYTYNTGANTATAHALLSVTNPDGSLDEFDYDSSGQLADTMSNGGADLVTFAYNQGEVSATDLLGGTTSYWFDADGLLARVEDALGNSTYYTYDSNFNLTQITDAAGQVYTDSYDSSGNLVSSSNPLGQTVNYTYSSTDNTLASVTDPNGNTTQYAYDGQGNLTSTTYPDGTVASVAYNPIGNVQSTTNQDGQAIHYTYDAAGNILTETFSDGSEVTYTYDTHENLTSATDSTGTITLTYDADDQLTRITYPSGRYLIYSYDAAGQRTQMVDQDGFTVNYAYDSLGRLASLTDGSGNLIVKSTYNMAGLLSRQDNGNGTYTTYNYDLDGDLLDLINFAPDGTVNSRFDYTYDSLGNPITEATLDGTWTYSYDPIGELIHAVFASTNPAIANQDLVYAYDAAGNRTQTIINGATTSYVTNDLKEYTQVGGTTYQYDADGNMISATDATGTTTYSYNVQNQLIGVTGPSGTAAYQYDPFGNLVATTQNGQTTQYLVDPVGLGNVVAAYTGAGSLIANYTYGLGLTGQVTASGAVSFYDFDGIGSTVGITNTAGQYVNQYSYLPFGQTTTVAASLTNPFTFVGQAGVMAEASGQYVMRARVYDSSSGRFLSEDPLGVNGRSTNLYAYARNQPTGVSDPSGLIPWATLQKYAWEKSAVLAAEIFAGPEAAIILSAYFTYEWLANDVFPWVIDLFLPQDTPGTYVPPDFHQPAYQLTPPPTLPEPGIFPPAPGRPLGPFITPPLPPATITAISSTAAARSADPNAKYGPAGYGVAGFIAADQILPYQIDFENEPSATAPAQRVDITDQLDSNLDWSTFQLTAVGFGDNNITIPPGTQNFQTSVTMTFNGQTFEVEINLALDAATGTFHASFQSINPATDLPPDPLTGFLPPEDGTGRGMGFVSFIVSPKLGQTTGSQIHNVALVTFDLGNTIATDQVDDDDPSQGVDPSKQDLNTIDASPPTSSVEPLPAAETTTSFPVSWSGQDDPGGSGVAFYNIFVSDNGGPYTLWQSDTTSTSAIYAGTSGHSYSFYSVATDNVGNVEATPESAQATTTVAGPPTSAVNALPPITNTPSFSLTWTGSPGPGASSITSYTIFESEDNGPFTAFLTNTTSTSTTVTGQLGHTYAFYSIATDNLGDVQPTPSAGQATTALVGPPTSKVNLLPAVTTAPSFTLSWSGSAGPGASSIASYSIFDSEDGGPFTALLTNTASTSATFTGQLGHTYAFYSVATDNLGDVQPTPSAAQATTALVGPPTSTVNLLPAVTTTPSFTLSWTGSPGPGASSIASYSIFDSEDGQPFTAFLTDTTSISTTFTGQFGHTYTFFSIATDNVGDVQPTPSAAQATTALVGAPISMINPLPSVTTTPSFTLSWVGSPGPGASTIASYSIFDSDDGGSFTAFLTNTTSTSTSFNGQPGHTYGFFSVATNNLGVVQPSPSGAQATIEVAPPPPTPLVTVTKVVDKLNKKHQVTEVDVTFSGPVNSAEADAPATYHLATPGKKNSFTAKNAGVIKLRSAKYTASTSTVTLTPRKPFALTKPVQLVVYGTGASALQDSFGRDIDGDDNATAGGNAVAILSRKMVTSTAAPLALESRNSATIAAVDALLNRGDLASLRPVFRDQGHRLGH